MKKFIINRFEGSFCVCETEDQSTVNIPKYKLPLDCKEGDYLILNSNGMYQKDNEQMKDKKNSIHKKINKILNS